MYLENTLGECRLNIFEIERRNRATNWREEKMTTATQPGIEPGTSRFPGDCSTS